MQKEFPPSSPVVEGIIHKGEFIILSAPAKTGKSFFSFNLAMAVAQGIKFLGKYNTTKGTVLIVQTEITNFFLQERIRNIPDLPFSTLDNVLISNRRIPLDSKEGIDELIETIEHFKPSFIILDPFCTFHHKDENSSQEMSKILNQLKEVIFKSNTSCLLIHHQGKANENGRSGKTGFMHRGSSVFADIPDGAMSLNRENPACLKLSFEFRNRPSPEPIAVNVNEDFHFSYSGETLSEKLNHPLLLKKHLDEFPGGKSRTEIFDYFLEKHKLSQSSAEKYMKEAASQRLVYKDKSQGTVRYFSTSL